MRFVCNRVCGVVWSMCCCMIRCVLRVRCVSVCVLIVSYCVLMSGLVYFVMFAPRVCVCCACVNVLLRA